MGQPILAHYPDNIIKNQKYSLLSFLPLVSIARSFLGFIPVKYLFFFLFVGAVATVFDFHESVFPGDGAVAAFPVPACRTIVHVLGSLGKLLTLFILTSEPFCKNFLQF